MLEYKSVEWINTEMNATSVAKVRFCILVGDLAKEWDGIRIIIDVFLMKTQVCDRRKKRHSQSSPSHLAAGSITNSSYLLMSCRCVLHYFNIIALGSHHSASNETQKNEWKTLYFHTLWQISLFMRSQLISSASSFVVTVVVVGLVVVNVGGDSQRQCHQWSLNVTGFSFLLLLVPSTFSYHSPFVDVQSWTFKRVTVDTNGKLTRKMKKKVRGKIGGQKNRFQWERISLNWK